MISGTSRRVRMCKDPSRAINSSGTSQPAGPNLSSTTRGTMGIGSRATNCRNPPPPQPAVATVPPGSTVARSTSGSARRRSGAGGRRAHTRREPDEDYGGSGGYAAPKPKAPGAVITVAVLVFIAAGLTALIGILFFMHTFPKPRLGSMYLVVAAIEVFLGVRAPGADLRPDTGGLEVLHAWWAGSTTVVLRR